MLGLIADNSVFTHRWDTKRTSLDFKLPSPHRIYKVKGPSLDGGIGEGEEVGTAHRARLF